MKTNPDVARSKSLDQLQPVGLKRAERFNLRWRRAKYLSQQISAGLHLADDRVGVAMGTWWGKVGYGAGFLIIACALHAVAVRGGIWHVLADLGLFSETIRS